MKTSNKARSILENIKGPALEYFAALAGNGDLLQESKGAYNYKAIAAKLGCTKEFDIFYALYSSATARSMEEAKEIYDDFYYFILEKICFPDGIY